MWSATIGTSAQLDFQHFTRLGIESLRVVEAGAREFRRFRLGAGRWKNPAASRTWRTAATATAQDVDDASHVKTLMEQLDAVPASFMADGADDRASVLDAVLAGNPSAGFVVPPCTNPCAQSVIGEYAGCRPLAPSLTSPAACRRSSPRRHGRLGQNIGRLPGRRTMDAALRRPSAGRCRDSLSR
jgi:hypothetical protein